MKVIKALATMQDLATGIGKVTQSRNNVNIEMDRIDVASAVQATADLQALDINKHHKARVYTADKSAFLEYMYVADATSGIAPNEGVGFWILTVNSTYAIGSVFGRQLVLAGDAASASSLLGISTYSQAVLAAVDQETFQAAIGLANTITSTGTTGALNGPAGDTAARPTPDIGRTRFNTDLNIPEYGDGQEWQEFGGAGGSTSHRRNTVLDAEVVSVATATEAMFSSTVLQCTGGSQAVDIGIDLTGADTGYLIIGKNMTNATGWFQINSVRGLGFTTDLAEANVEEVTNGHVSALTATGFSVNGHADVNPNNTELLLECWKLTKRFSGVTNTGRAYECHYNPQTGISVTVVEAGTSDGSQLVPSHLNQKTELVTQFILSEAGSNTVSHESFGAGEYLTLESSNGLLTTTTNDMIHVDGGVILSGTAFNLTGRYMVVQKHSVEGFSDIGLYNPSGEAGYELNLGFQAGYWLGKRLDTTGNWILEDTVRSGQFLMPDEANAEGVSGQLSFTDTGVIFNAAGHPAWNVIGSFLYESYAASVTVANARSLANYDMPTVERVLTLAPSVRVSLANGASDRVIAIGNNETYEIPVGLINRDVFVHIDGTGTVGHSLIPPVEGRSRTLSDHWGTESHNGLRTTDVHSGYQSPTGVVSASAELGAGSESHRAFNRSLLVSAINTRWIVSTVTTSNLQYSHSERRVLDSARFREAEIADRYPARFTYEGSDDGITWVTLIDTFAASDYTGNGINLWGDLLTSDSTVGYFHHRINITANAGAATFTAIGEMEFNTSAPVGDFYNVTEGLMYDEGAVEGPNLIVNGNFDDPLGPEWILPAGGTVAPNNNTLVITQGAVAAVLDPYQAVTVEPGKPLHVLVTCLTSSTGGGTRLLLGTLVDPDKYYDSGLVSARTHDQVITPDETTLIVKIVDEQPALNNSTWDTLIARLVTNHIERVYLAKVRTDSSGDIAQVDNFPVGRSALGDLDVYGLFRTHGNRKILKFGIVNIDSRYAIPLPDGWDWADCEATAWVLTAGLYVQTGWYSATGTSRGTYAYATSEGVIVQTGATQVVNNNANYSGGSAYTVGLNSVECIVVVTNLGRTANA
ncbi:MAG: hypothetical protein HRU18_06775 [Pseudoalteromonas sp.]|uniref:hypothetical protein n=1 Tax=Pseudoalteromonas sp. TaxID=53249 RepID=UPI001DE1B9D9|nr:hypothetical protein [Pseudoalteromonas sp.]NRA77894.1 hypothetical protein [Pseudoalteromonas sp.]